MAWTAEGEDPQPVPTTEPRPEAQVRRGRGLVGAVGIVLSAGYLVAAWQLPIGALDRPGAAVFPIAVGVVAFLISGATIVQSFRYSGPIPSDVDAGDDLEPATRADRFRPVWVIVLLALYVFGLAQVGFLVATIPFLVAYAFLVKPDLPRLRLLLYGVIFAVLTQVVFEQLLEVRLP